MDTAQRRVLGLVAVASWILIDTVRAAGPLLSYLFDTGLYAAVAAALATFAAGGVLAWLATIAAHHFGHGNVLMYMLGVVAVLRFGLGFTPGGWMVAFGLYLVAFALTAVLLATRVAMGNGGSGTAVAGASIGAAAAVAEQTALRTWDAVWRADASGWVALAIVAVLAVGAAWQCRTLTAAPLSRGWWAYGLWWSLLLFAFANVAFLNSQTGLRMSGGALLAIVSLCVGAALAAQVQAVSRIVASVLAALGIGAVAVLMLVPGSTAALALPVAVATTALAAAQSLRVAEGGAFRRLMGATVFGLAMITPIMLVQLDYDISLRVPHLLVMVVAGAAVIGYGMWFVWRADREADAPWIAPGVLPRVAAGVGMGCVVAGWTYASYESPRTYSATFIEAPYVVTWNTHYGVTPRIGEGPGVDLEASAAAISDTGADVIMLQEVSRGWILAGGTDQLEYLAGELGLPFSYVGAHDEQFGNAIFTSRPHSEARTIALPVASAPQDRSVLAVDFMGATFATTHLSAKGSDAERAAQVEALVAWLDGPQPLVVGGDFNATPDSDTVAAVIDAGFVSVNHATSAPTFIGAEPGAIEPIEIDYLFGRSVEFTQFETLPWPWSDHLPLFTRVTTGAVAPTEVDVDSNELQTPEPTVSPSASASPSATN